MKTILKFTAVFVLVLLAGTSCRRGDTIQKVTELPFLSGIWKNGSDIYGFSSMEREFYDDDLPTVIGSVTHKFEQNIAFGLKRTINESGTIVLETFDEESQTLAGYFDYYAKTTQIAGQGIIPGDPEKVDFTIQYVDESTIKINGKEHTP